MIMQSKGFTFVDIGIALACGSLVGLLGQIFWGGVSDKFRTIKKAVLGLFILSMTLLGGLYVSESFAAVWLSAVWIRFCTASILPFTDLWTMNFSESRGTNFGKYRMWNSIGAVALTFLMGMTVTSWGLQSVYGVQLLLLFACILLVSRLPDSNHANRNPAIISESFKLLKDRAIWPFCTALLLICIPARAFEGFFSVYMKSLGGSDMMIAGTAITAGLIEVPLFWLGSRWLNKFGVWPLLMISGGVYSAVWLLNIWNLPLWCVAATLIMLNVAHVLLYLAAMMYLRIRIAESMRSTGQMLLYMSLFSISGFIGTMGAGSLLSDNNAAFMYVISLACVGMAIVILRGLHKKGFAADGE